MSKNKQGCNGKDAEWEIIGSAVWRIKGMLQRHGSYMARTPMWEATRIRHGRYKQGCFSPLQI